MRETRNINAKTATVDRSFEIYAQIFHCRRQHQKLKPKPTATQQQQHNNNMSNIRDTNNVSETETES